ncbi:MAG TPA: DUF1080 domain-containing protein [Gemmataceae bacterium]
MSRSSARRALPGVALTLLGCGLLAGARADDPPEGFARLFNGKDLTGFRSVVRGDDADPAKTWSVKDGIIICTGQPYGYLYTERPYKNYVLRYDWRYVRPDGLKDDSMFTGNSGLLVHIQGEHKVWPSCIEVQGMNGHHGEIFRLGEVEFKQTKFDKKAQQAAVKPVGEWNTTEVTCQGNTVTSRLNGTLICSGEGNVSAGPIGWQSEGAEIHLRNICIKELK